MLGTAKLPHMGSMSFWHTKNIDRSSYIYIYTVLVVSVLWAGAPLSALQDSGCSR